MSKSKKKGTLKKTSSKSKTGITSQNEEAVKKYAKLREEFSEGRDWADFMQDGWRVFKIMAEFVTGFEKMAEIGPSVTVFGSARVKPDDPYYKIARDMGWHLAKHDLGVITGGGPGIMEAANKGAKEAGGASIGFNIYLEHEQSSNPYIDHDKLITFNYFFVRKVMFVKYSQAFIVMPGGYGTLDELAEAMTLIQTKKIKVFPVILIGKDYWADFVKWMKKSMMQENAYISPNDMDYLFLVDSADEAIDIITRFYPEEKYMPNF